MDELFNELLRITEEAAASREQLTDEQWKAFMRQRTDLMIRIRRMDAELPEGAEVRRAFKPIVERLAMLDAQLIGQMHEVKEEAARQLRGIHAGRRQKQAYELEEIMEEGFFVDKRR
ncbi:hypothetical protein [Cohnella sp. JJ-181]|uniref:hypothetical protein n=1 Tax=Cohnella rhizoplanae TaxID=2974897 RepID=UPI0022FF68ED|nr:hypothetical protein [Cohnella sp. JJ-181]CAI6084390.1 hypothetical protein COHCIP112018_04322 [Cohnella sp. JJ-181]